MIIFLSVYQCNCKVVDSTLQHLLVMQTSHYPLCIFGRPEITPYCQIEKEKHPQTEEYEERHFE
jgi:hypothetical protein